MTLLAVAVSGRGLVDPDEPVVHADDEAFLRGRGAFETTRVYAGKPFRLAEHLDRLAESVRRLGLPPVDRSEIEGLVRAALDAAAAEEASLRVYYTPGREGRDRPLSLAMVGSLPPGLEEMRERGIGLISVPLGQVGPAPLGGVKSTSYALNMVAVHEAKHRGEDDAVFLAEGGIVLEGPTTNVWWRHGQELFTPALELGVLAGVTRAVLLDVAPQLGYDVREGSFPLAELAGGEEAFTSSSVREVMPVVRLDGEQVGSGSPGPAAAAMQQALRDRAAY